ncbi:tRNA (adenosine(37)-N6)-threonylcarbamoyltransferase complex transferase subunit TsaD [Candidatus Woesearchaeota archaeon]|nr:tRNA (adenosine(37)-N6)-threonylcarbamoyltransferase complex transferase subunit TsaD [Candidatus Woesearchaeota archaeon]
MLCLGIETTAHTFGASVVTGEGKILSEVRDMYTTTEGGMIPNEVKKHHLKIGDKVIEDALTQANVKKEDIDFVALSNAPGLAPCLLAGMEIAKRWALRLEIPLVPVNHICAHLEIGKLLTNAKDPIFVFVSGANTQIIALEGGRYRVFGETLCVGIGNALDKFGREVGLGFPAGPKIEELAKRGKYVELPYAVKGMDVAFSGIITKAGSMVKSGKYKLEDICYSLQETLFAMVTEITERALAHCDKDEVLVIGGVAANSRFKEMLETMCLERNAKYYAAPLRYAGDNAAMIAWLGIMYMNSGYKPLKLEEIDILPKERSDDIDVFWVL